MRRLAGLWFGVLLCLCVATAAFGLVPAGDLSNARGVARLRPTIAPLAGVAAAELSLDDDIPGVAIPPSTTTDTLDYATDLHDVYAVYLEAGQTLTAYVEGPEGSWFTPYLFSPSAGTVIDNFDAVLDGNIDMEEEYPHGFFYSAEATGTYYVDVWVWGGAPVTSGTYTLDWSIKPSVRLSLHAPAHPEYRNAPIYGYLKDGAGNALVDQSIEIYADNGGFVQCVDTVHTDARGRWSRTMAPKRATTYSAYYAGTSELGERLAGDTVLPQVRLTRISSWSSLSIGKTYTSTGRIEPPHGGTSSSNKVHIRAYKKGSDGAYHYVKSFAASYVHYSDSKTTYKAPIKFSKSSAKGSWKFVAYHATDETNYKTYGSADYVTVK